MMTLVPDSPPPVAARSPFWRVLQLIAGALLFLYALRLLPPMPQERVGFAVIAALLAAGAMALSDSVVGLVATVFENLHKGGRQ
jgi:peptidoglycan/LPS O-acetylase OafA/YrhL